MAVPDPSFGAAGLATVAFGPDASATAVAVAPDGDIVVVGSVETAPDEPDFALARLDPDGTLDEGFSGDGRVTLNLAEGSGNASGVAIRPNGRVIVAGTVDGRFAVVQLLPNGTLDDDFAGNGVTVFGFGGPDSGSASDLALDGGGNVVVVGSGPSERPAGRTDVAVARLTPAGDLDESFGGNGKVTAGAVEIGDPFISSDYASAVAIEPDGDIAFAGGYFVVPDSKALFGELSPDGSVKAMRTLGAGRDFGGSDLAVLESGDPLVVGDYQPHSAPGGDAMAWLIGPGGTTESWAFSAPGDPDLRLRADASAVAALDGERAIVGASTETASGDRDGRLLLFDPETDDGFVADGRIAFVPGDVAVAGGGSVVAAGSIESDFVVGRFLPPTEPPPRTKITDGPRGKVDGPTVKFRFRSIPAGGSFLCRLDDHYWHECDSPYKLGPLTLGHHRFRVRAVSETGRRDRSPAKRDFVVE